MPKLVHVKKFRYRNPWTCPKCGQTFKQGGYHRPRCGKWEEWFWSKIDKRGDEECWLWIGVKDKSGYGRAARKGPNVYPHRVAWRLKNGEIPADMEVAHRCDVRNCCNPAHLFLATHDENMADMRNKHRHPQFLKRDQVIEICRLIKESPKKRGYLAAIARQTGQLDATIGKIALGKTYRHITVSLLGDND